ncbi:RSP_7527 family protein [Bradyrhizobium sp. USDA 10063]
MRRDPTRRVTPELLAFHIKRAHALREEACRNMMRALWDWLMKALRGH